MDRFWKFARVLAACGALIVTSGMTQEARSAEFAPKWCCSGQTCCTKYRTDYEEEEGEEEGTCELNSGGPCCVVFPNPPCNNITQGWVGDFIMGISVYACSMNIENSNGQYSWGEGQPKNCNNNS